MSEDEQSLSGSSFRQNEYKLLLARGLSEDWMKRRLQTDDPKQSSGKFLKAFRSLFDKCATADEALGLMKTEMTERSQRGKRGVPNTNGFITRDAKQAIQRRSQQLSAQEGVGETLPTGIQAKGDDQTGLMLVEHSPLQVTLKQRRHPDTTRHLAEKYTEELGGIQAYIARCTALFSDDTAPRLKHGYQQVQQWMQHENMWAAVTTVQELLAAPEGARGGAVLYGTEQDFLELERLGVELSPFNVVTGDAALSADEYRSRLFEQLRALYGKDAEIEAQNYDMQREDDKPTYQISIRDAEKLFDAAGAPIAAMLSDRSRVQRQHLPLNCLNISGRHVFSDLAPPECITSPRYKILQDLCGRLEGRLRRRGARTAKRAPAKAGNVGKKSYKRVARARDVDVEECLRFVLAGKLGTFSGNHVDLLNGTWVRCLSGLKAWFVYTGPFGEEERRAFADEGEGWTPAAGMMQLILLTPGDTLIMKPGVMCVHAPLSVTDCLMAGGMLWDKENLAMILDNVSWILQKQIVTNEPAGRQLPSIIETLIEWANKDGGYFGQALEELTGCLEAFKEKMADYLACWDMCRGRCGWNCPCVASRDATKQSKERGCTEWCHPVDFFESDRACIQKNGRTDEE